MSFKEQYNNILTVVKSDIERVNSELISFINLDEPLKSKLIEFLTSPSKRIRPLLMFLFLRANNIEINERHYTLATAVELVHNASLIHDDIIDNSKVRRTIKTLNFEFDNKLAVIAGDYLLSIALHKISLLNSPETIDMFANTLSMMCDGETFQYFNKYKIPTLENYIKKSEQKTAKLFETALKSSFLISNSDIADKAEDFGKNFGIAFQIHDDLINAKTSQSDISDGIYTAPIIYSNSIDNLSSGIEKTFCLLNNYIDRAKQNLQEIENNKYKQALLELLEIYSNE